MSTMTYLARRTNGVFYVQIRVTRYSGRRDLLRFSLGTREKNEARQRLLGYLTWLLPMQSAAVPAPLFHTILSVAKEMILQGPAKTVADVNYRSHFMRTGWAHREDWRLSDPCPIRDSVSYASQEEVRVTLVMLNEMLKEDIKRLGMVQADTNFLLQPAETVQALCFDRRTGAVRAYLPEEFADAYDHLPASAFGVRSSEISIFDVYYDQNGQPTPFEPAARAEAAVASAPRASVSQPIVLAPTPHPASPTTTITIKVARDEYLETRRTKQGDGRAAEDAGLIIDFLIDLIGDKPLDALSSADLRAFEMAMAKTPDRKGLPVAASKSLFTRYDYARTHGFDGLKMISEKRITNVWHGCLHQFFAWLKNKEIVTIGFRFTLVPANALESKSRDAWQADELIRLFSLPLFTGCFSRVHYWTPGPFLIQNELYWAYLLIFFTGMRNSEIGSLKVANIIQHDGMWVFDLGAEKRKSDAGRRLVPIPRLLLDLGILDRHQDVMKEGTESFFPEWKHFKNRKSDRDMPGHHLSKSWQYVKVKFGFDREDLTIYGGRHTRAGWYDELNLPDRIRDRLLGHASKTVAGNYGANKITAGEARLAAVTLPIEERIAEILIEAKLRTMVKGLPEDQRLTAIRTW